MIIARLMLPAAVSAAVGAMVIVTASVRGPKNPRFKTTGARLEPVSLGADYADWSQAPVYGAPLLIRYREAGGELTETVIQPKNIVGRKVQPRGVRPDTVNAFCRTRHAMRAFQFDDIVWAADAQSGEFIEDLYLYLGGAQPGGAPAPVYEKAEATPEHKRWKRYW